jgi:hypothetical protein
LLKMAVLDKENEILKRQNKHRLVSVQLKLDKSILLTITNPIPQSAYTCFKRGVHVGVHEFMILLVFKCI